MVTDQEPRYRLVDSNGNVVGSLFAESDGTLKLQEGTSGNENELSLTTDGALGVEQIIGGSLFAGAFDGNSPDARLDNALAAASDGDSVALENAEYTSPRTVSKSVSLMGSFGANSDQIGTRINLPNGTDEWAFDAGAVLSNITVSTGILRLNAFGSRVTGGRFGGNAGVRVSADEAVLTGLVRAFVTFESGTADGVVDTSISTSVTDNGSNVVGDIT